MSKVDHDPQRPAIWHPGEVALQSSIGMAKAMAALGPDVIRDAMAPADQAAFEHLPFVVVGAVDPHGAPWASLITGKPGFATALTPRRLRVATRRDRSDPAASGLNEGDKVGLLAIALDTRQQNRVNGRVCRRDDTALEVAVEQSFRNGPQHIQLRETLFHRDPGRPSLALADHLPGLDAEARDLIASADTLFVASYVDRGDGEREVDVAHRGGRPGFVRVDPDGSLTIPDFAGDPFFATLGNLWSNPLAGLLFIDFERGDTLQMTGRATVILTDPQIAAFQGAERLWRFTPGQIVRRRDTLALRWIADRNGQSHDSLLTGDWPTAARNLTAVKLGAAWRPFRVAGIREENCAIRSIFLEPADGAGLLPSTAGQHLPIRLKPNGCDRLQVRRYALSSAPSDAVYRISVLGEGLVARHLMHDVRIGDVVEVRPPTGGLAFDVTEPRPAMLLAAGLGVAPMVSMLRHAAYEGARTQRFRPTWLIYGERRCVDRCFDGELAALVVASRGAFHMTRMLWDLTGAEAGRDYDLAGPLDADLLRSLPLGGDEIFYLCGPVTFMQPIYDALRDIGVADHDIHAESFGPSEVTRQTGDERLQRRDFAGPWPGGRKAAARPKGCRLGARIRIKPGRD